MVSVCLPSDALLQLLPSYLGFSYLGHGVSLHGCSSKAQPLLLTLNEVYLLTTTLPDLQHGIATLGPPESVQPRLLGCGVGPPGCRLWPRAWERGVVPLGMLSVPVAAAAPLSALVAAAATQPSQFSSTSLHFSLQKASYLCLLFSIAMHSVGYIFPFLPCLLLLFFP